MDTFTHAHTFFPTGKFPLTIKVRFRQYRKDSCLRFVPGSLLYITISQVINLFRTLPNPNFEYARSVSTHFPKS